MSTELQTKLHNFLVNAEEQQITSGSVIYKAIEDNPWVEKDELKDIIKKAVSFAKKRSIQGSLQYGILCDIIPEKVVPNMVPESLLPIIENRCGEFVRNFITSGHTQLSQALIHDGKWKESDEKLAEKIDDDAVKLWRETNNGMYWVYKGCRPEKDEFGIIGLQVAGPLLRLTVLIRDSASFIKTLLILRNILIVNMTLIPHGSLPKSERQKENSSTVDSDSD
ncbi:16587_t:CDS:2 [Dentiscutata erythropus]|uniref:16587_t:CDS:1 n=1 Tax=Dentiscutata erythropus TaxID=1348616 RepID=A0A9N9EEP6_9GLOM|nr:16587_t:CDS:2 [Dentiscutata erythropus]